MRKILILGFVASLVLSVVPATAGGDNRVTIDPNPVKSGEEITVTAKDCKSGDDWDAKVEIKITKNGNRKLKRLVEAEDDGTTKEDVRLRKDKFPPGTYRIRVRCRHYFDNDEIGTWYSITKTLTVEE